jgi:hypothetical protein
VNPVESQDNHDDEVGNQQGCVEGIPAIEMLERLVPIVGLQVMAKAFGSKQQPK